MNTLEGLVVVDEAYIILRGTGLFDTELNDIPICCTATLRRLGNGGLRLGMAFASTGIMNHNKVKPPYNINQATQELVLRDSRNRPGE